jgi:hypothetical protein
VFVGDETPVTGERVPKKRAFVREFQGSDQSLYCLFPHIRRLLVKDGVEGLPR